MGKAEAIRLLFEDNGIEYKEIRFTGQEWRQGGLKQEYLEKGISLFGQVPIVSIGDEHMCQTNAILRHFARVHDLYGNDNAQMYQADLVADGVDDWRKNYVSLVYGDFDNKIGAYLDKDVPSTIETFEKILSRSKGQPFFVRSEKPTFADYLVLDMLILLHRLQNDCLDKHSAPLLKKFYETMMNRKGIDAYLKSGRRPENANNSKRG
jgi:glutathione S-transferase